MIKEEENDSKHEENKLFGEWSEIVVAIDGRVLKREEYRRVGKIRSDKEWYIKKFIMYLGKYIVNTKRYLAIQQLNLIKKTNMNPVHTN